MSSFVNRPVNPYKRGKSKVIGSLILEERTDEQVLDFIRTNKLDENFSVPVSMDNIHDVRAGLRRSGLINSEGRIIVKAPKDINLPGLESISEKNSGGLDKNTKQSGSTEKEPPANQPPIFTRRPDWDLLTPEMIEKIPDPKLKMDILNYKTDVIKQKQEFKPEFATREQFDSVAGRLGGIEEKINQLLNRKNEPDPEEDEEEEEEPEEEETEEVEAVTPNKKSKISTKVNPLAEDTTQGEDEVMEVEGNVISKKMIGFTAKSLMLFDIARKQGFPGNIADFVNACVSDAYKGRNIELAIVDKKVIR